MQNLVIFNLDLRRQKIEKKNTELVTKKQQFEKREKKKIEKGFKKGKKNSKMRIVKKYVYFVVLVHYYDILNCQSMY